MTIASLLIGTFASQVIFVLLKVFFINSLDLDNWVVMTVFFLALIITTIAVIRRMGILNYIESIFLVVVWFITTLIVDVAITAQIVGYDIYKTWYYWLTFVAIILAMMIFHKKLHVQVRHSNK